MKRFLWSSASMLVIVVGFWVIKTNAQMQLHAMTRLTPHTFGDLTMADGQGAAHPFPDGNITYCSDCAKPATPGAACAGGGPGAEAHRIRGAWSCF